MTITETYNLLKMLLDDSRLFYITKELATRLINEAQLQVVKDAHLKNDERCLRPLYETQNPHTSGLPLGDDRFLYPRACIWYQDGNYATIDKGEALNYQEPQIYFSFEGDLSGRTRGGYYTITKDKFDMGGSEEPRAFLFFTTKSPTNYASLTYVRYPVEFGDNELELPEEYHPQVVALAAEMANDIDVNESQRGEPIFQNRQITLEQTGVSI